jgi:hypothetical protein
VRWFSRWAVARVCRAAANQVHLVLHTAAFWLMRAVRSAIPDANPLAKAEFATIRGKFMKIGARVIEDIARIRVHLPTSCPERTVSSRRAEPDAALTYSDHRPRFAPDPRDRCTIPPEGLPCFTSH